jgi:hypothetical protein
LLPIVVSLVTHPIGDCVSPVPGPDTTACGGRSGSFDPADDLAWLATGCAVRAATLAQPLRGVESGGLT